MDERHFFTPPFHEQRERGETFPRLRQAVALGVERKLVPDIAAVNFGHEIHVRPVIFGQNRKANRRMKRTKIAVGVAAKKRQGVLGRGQAQPCHHRVGCLAHQIRHGNVLAGRILVRGQLAQFAGLG